jgi:hypothetical protein
MKQVVAPLFEDELQRTLPQGKAQKEFVAKKLAMSTRTLSGRLAERAPATKRLWISCGEVSRSNTLKARAYRFHRLLGG